MLDALPYRGDGTSRVPRGSSLPPAPMPRRIGRRPLKRWRYVGVYGPELMLCAGMVRVGRDPADLLGGLGPRGRAPAGSARSCAAGGSRCPTVLFASPTARSPSISSSSPPASRSRSSAATAPRYIWTRKSPVRATGLVTLEGRTLAVDACGLIDETAGYHARHTAWEWSAGAGIAADGEAVVWNLVAGVHDAPRGSERTVWIDGVPREVGPSRVRRGPRRRRRPALRARGRARAPRRPAADRQRLPPAVRDLRRHPARRHGAGERPRRHGAPPSALVTACLARPRPTRSRDRRRPGRRRRPGPAAGAGARAGRRRPGGRW